MNRSRHVKLSKSIPQNTHNYSNNFQLLSFIHSTSLRSSSYMYYSVTHTNKLRIIIKERKLCTCRHRQVIPIKYKINMVMHQWLRVSFIFFFYKHALHIQYSIICVFCASLFGFRI